MIIMHIIILAITNFLNDIKHALNISCIMYTFSYYADGRTGIMAEFYNITLLDTFISTAVYHKTVCTSSAPGVDVWIGETASMYGGGTKGLSDSFIAGFM